MKSLIKYFAILSVSLLFSSCLKYGLDEIPTYSNAEIKKMSFEYRWIDTTKSYDQLRVVQLNTISTISASKDTIGCAITVPAVNKDFPAEVRTMVALNNLVAYADISEAATIRPLADAPKLGVLGNFDKPLLKYEVIAADGSKKVWVLKITGFGK